MIIADYSQVALSGIFAFQKELRTGASDSESATNIVRHAVLSSIKGYKKMFTRDYGEFIIACDGREYWRKRIFPYYKANRKALREQSDLDWKLIFTIISSIRDDLKEYFPYKVICIDDAEADDVIGTLVAWTQKNSLVENDIFEEKQPVLIISSDGDFKQLHKYDNVRQFDPRKKKWVKCEDPKKYLAAHIAKAGDDGIPNVLSPDDVFMRTDLRQKSMRADNLARFVELGRDACLDDYQRKNWDRNNTLINLDLIPEDIMQRIIDAYLNTKVVCDKMKIYNYLVQKRCRLLLNEIEEF